MEEPERRADEGARGMSPGDLQGQRGGDGWTAGMRRQEVAGPCRGDGSLIPEREPGRETRAKITDQGPPGVASQKVSE